MAPLLAPYQPSMRLGSGFNTYTQQLCVDNAVIRDESAPKLEPIATQSKLQPPEIAQSVIFKTEIITKVSDLTDALDVNGALTIKASNIASARGNGSFVNSDVVSESDINFLVTCKVINQTFNDNSLTKFNPLANTNNTNFTDIFGDAFVSGYQLGGEFTALISIKVHDKSQVNSITAEAQIAFTTPNFVGGEDPKTNETEKLSEGGGGGGAVKNDTDTTDKTVEKTTPKTASSEAVAKKPASAQNKGISIDADAKFKKSRIDIMSQNTVTISVAWTGGGQQLKKEGDDWNFETVRNAAIKFPELVSATPVRTHAILTKYTTLRTYYSSINKANAAPPASYENAGVYTGMLQDAYLDYKTLYKDLQLLGLEVDSGKKKLKVNDGKLLLADQPSKGDSESKSAKFEAKIDTPTSASSEVDSNPTVDGEPKKNDVLPTQSKEITLPPAFARTTPYAASLIGIEVAKRDIRINMGRILAEVDAIAKDPSLAMNEEKEPTFMIPLLFKQYLPQGEVIGQSQDLNQKA